MTDLERAGSAAKLWVTAAFVSASWSCSSGISEEFVQSSAGTIIVAEQRGAQSRLTVHAGGPVRLSFASAEEVRVLILESPVPPDQLGLELGEVDQTPRPCFEPLSHYVSFRSLQLSEFSRALGLQGVVEIPGWAQGFSVPVPSAECCPIVESTFQTALPETAGQFAVGLAGGAMVSFRLQASGDGADVVYVRPDGEGTIATVVGEVPFMPRKRLLHGDWLWLAASVLSEEGQQFARLRLSALLAGELEFESLPDPPFRAGVRGRLEVLVGGTTVEDVRGFSPVGEILHWAAATGWQFEAPLVGLRELGCEEVCTRDVVDEGGFEFIHLSGAGLGRRFGTTARLDHSEKDPGRFRRNGAGGLSFLQVRPGESTRWVDWNNAALEWRPGLNVLPRDGKNSTAVRSPFLGEDISVAVDGLDPPTFFLSRAARLCEPQPFDIAQPGPNRDLIKAGDRIYATFDQIYRLELR